MSEPPEPRSARVAGFRARLFAALMLVVATVALLALYFAESRLAAGVEEEIEREFEGQVRSLRHAEDMRAAALVERCRALARKPRIRAAFEDDALDLLYANAEDELRDIVAGGERAVLSALFHRFLDQRGAVIAPGRARAVGILRPEEERRLTLPRAPDAPQIGYIAVRSDTGVERVAMTMATPISSSETAEPIGALVLGFRPFDFAASGARGGIRSGVRVEGRLLGEGFSPDVARVAEAVASEETPGPARIEIGGAPHLLFVRRLNPGSLFPPAHEVCVYPLTELAARQRQLRWQIFGAGAALLLLGLGASHAVASRLAGPVERLAVDSEVDRAGRARAEARLETTSEELKRSARFSADASHQLKTPVTVLRAGLEELMAREGVSAAEREELAALVHQTYRLSSLIEDLLLLSRMDAGRLRLELAPLDLSELIEASLDDLGARPDAAGIEVRTDFPRPLFILGERRHTAIILQNLFDNARKYGGPSGWIEVRAAEKAGVARLTVANGGAPIPPEAQPHIFERFHRGAAGENMPGHGLGLNLARELARLHGGDLRLAQSDGGGTVFEVEFRAASARSGEEVG